MNYPRLMQIATCFIVAVLSVISVQGASCPNGDPTTPILISQIPEIAEGTPRVPQTVRIEAVLDWGLYVVHVWLQNAGTSVTVDIVNTTTETSYQYFVSGNSLESLPISSDSGFWTITFTLQDGRVYGGTFII